MVKETYMYMSKLICIVLLYCIARVLVGRVFGVGRTRSLCRLAENIEGSGRLFVETNRHINRQTRTYAYVLYSYVQHNNYLLYFVCV